MLWSLPCCALVYSTTPRPRNSRPDPRIASEINRGTSYSPQCKLMFPTVQFDVPYGGMDAPYVAMCVGAHLKSHRRDAETDIQSDGNKPWMVKCAEGNSRTIWIQMNMRASCRFFSSVDDRESVLSGEPRLTGKRLASEPILTVL